MAKFYSQITDHFFSVKLPEQGLFSSFSTICILKLIIKNSIFVFAFAFQNILLYDLYTFAIQRFLP